MIPSFNRPTGNESVAELADMVAKLQKQVEFLMTGNLSTKNIREIAGWLIDYDRFVSADGDVGMSTEDAGPDSVRFWAGGTDPNTAVWKVLQSGIMEAIGAIFKSANSGMRVVMDETGLHAYDEDGIERITIGTTPAKGAKALITRDAAGVEQGVYTYDTETVDGTARTGQFITAHGAYILISDDGDIRLQGADGKGFRAVSGTPEMNDGFGWVVIAKKSDVDAKATVGVSTSSDGALTLNGGIPIGTSLATAGGGSVTWAGITVPSHSHTQN